jgi:hypothetical protein
VATLTSLQVLDVRGWLAPDGWELLVQLPLLQCLKVSPEVEAIALGYVPHLCWEK